jgi:hypothetical protein
VHTTIEKLALAAGGSHYPSVNPRQLEAFYRLVVTECADWIVANSGSLTDLSPEHLATSMKKQFGVESQG